jgi:hypothetical protein
MNINIHIERLILDGLPATVSQGSEVQTAVAAELTRLLTEQGLDRVSESAMPRLSAESVQLSKEIRPTQLGTQIAKKIYSALEPATTPPRPHRSNRGLSA